MASVFSKIIAGEIPGRFVWRDDEVVVFLTIAPITKGHVLVVPVAEVDKWTDLDPALWGRLNEVAQHVGQAVIDGFGAERAGYIVAGFEVPHAHIHVFPANGLEVFDFSLADPNADPAEMDDAAEIIREALRSGGHGEFVTG